MEYRAIGGSMAPFILPGSRLEVEKAAVEEIRKGDVVCYVGQQAGGVAHRVVQITLTNAGTRLTTRGDAQRFFETVEEPAVLFVVRRVNHRLYSYDTNSVMGRKIASIALAETMKNKAIKRVFINTYNWSRLVLNVKHRIMDSHNKEAG